MGSNFNFNNFGTDPSAAAGGGGRPPAVNFPLMRQHSIYSLTFDEFQSSVGGIGKDFGSMNMDELLKSIWSAEENQNIGSAAAIAAGSGGGDGQEGSAYLQRQGSLTLPRTLSQKTVDEVWRDISNEHGEAKGGGGGGGGGGCFSMPQRQQTLREVTLEEFLMRAGVVREEAQMATKPNNIGLFGDLSRASNNSGLGFGYQAANVVGGRIAESILPLNVNGAPKQPTLGYGAPMGIIPSSNPLSGPGIRGGINGISNPPTNNNTMVQNVTLESGGLGMVGIGSSSVSSDGVSKSNGDTSSVSPVLPYVFNGGGLRGRKSASLEKVVERRQRRMIKNRESAARSRARKQAYTTELEAEVAKLKEENEELRKRQAEMIELQNNEVTEMMNQQNGNKKRCLRRTQTGPW